MIQETKTTTVQIPTASAQPIPVAVIAAAAAANTSHAPDRAFSAQSSETRVDVSLSALSEHHGDQEDYLWGV
jgi:hypothetical protein